MARYKHAAAARYAHEPLSQPFVIERKTAFMQFPAGVARYNYHRALPGLGRL